MNGEERTSDVSAVVGWRRGWVMAPSGTMAISKPYFVWNEETTATEYRLKVVDATTTVTDQFSTIRCRLASPISTGE